MNTKTKILNFPSAPTCNPFNEDDAIEITERLCVGRHGSTFSDAELSIIEHWGGEDLEGKGIFYSEQITSAYGIESEPGSEPGQYTWPRLAALLRSQKARKL